MTDTPTHFIVSLAAVGQAQRRTFNYKTGMPGNSKLKYLFSYLHAKHKHLSPAWPFPRTPGAFDHAPQS